MNFREWTEAKSLLTDQLNSLAEMQLLKDTDRNHQSMVDPHSRNYANNNTTPDLVLNLLVVQDIHMVAVEDGKYMHY